MVCHWKLRRAPRIDFIGFKALNLPLPAPTDPIHDHHRFTQLLFPAPELVSKSDIEWLPSRFVLCNENSSLSSTYSTLKLRRPRKNREQRENARQATSRCDASEASPSTPSFRPGLVSCTPSTISELPRFLPISTTRLNKDLSLSPYQHLT